MIGCMFTTSSNIWLCRCSGPVLHQCSTPSVMVHEQDVTMLEMQVCSPARKYFLLHSRDLIQNNAGADFVSAQDNALQGNYFEKKKNIYINPLNPELNPICYLLALLGAKHFLHVSRIRVKLLTLRLLMSYMYIWSTHS